VSNCTVIPVARVCLAAMESPEGERNGRATRVRKAAQSFATEQTLPKRAARKARPLSEDDGACLCCGCAAAAALGLGGEAWCSWHAPQPRTGGTL